MTTRERAGSTFDAELAGLPAHDAGPERVTRIRAECLAVLARSRRRQAARRQAKVLWRARLEALAATGLAALFLAAAIERALEIFS